MDPPAVDETKVDHVHTSTYPPAEEERVPSPPVDGAATEEADVVALPEDVEVEVEVEPHAHDEPLDPAVTSEARPPSPLPSSRGTPSDLPHPQEAHYHHEMGGYHPYYPPPHHHHYYPPHHPHHPPPPPPPHGWPAPPNASAAGTPAPHHYSTYHHYPPPPHNHPHHHHRSKSSPPPSDHISRGANAENVYPATPSHRDGSRYHHHRHNSNSSSSTMKVPTSSRRHSDDASGDYYHSSSSAQKVSPTTPASGSKAQRGLRHFSIMVCRFVEQRRVTTYNQVADELVRQVAAERKTEKPKGKFDEKNIRRRVYDALNVLLAMDIISKEKKDIIWKGLPTTPLEEHDDNAEDAVAAEDAEAEEQVQPVYTDEAEYEPYEFEAMERERQYREVEIKRKHDALREILVQQVCFRNLVLHNRERDHAPHPITTVRSASSEDEMPPPPTTPPSTVPPAFAEDEKIPLPFIICNTKPSAVVQCDMNKEKSDVMFEFDSPFEINDDNTILKRMKMDKASVPALQDMMPEDMFSYLHQAGLLEAVLLPGGE